MPGPRSICNLGTVLLLYLHFVRGTSGIDDGNRNTIVGSHDTPEQVYARGNDVDMYCN
jgi:hypothetical protein